jgi:cobalt-zinc-cadmium efflux system protein
MADGHGHDGARGHVHGFGGSSLRALVLALILNAVYTVVEALAGVLTDSLALLSDAGHNLSDVLALAVAAGAVWLARRPPTLRTSFGLKRAEILAALVNAVTLIAIAIVVIVAALRRLADPPEVPGGWLIVVAAVGLLINTVGAALVFRRGGRDLNLRASFLHLAGDALGSLGVIVAGVVIVVTGWPYADPIFSIVLAVLILATSWFVLRDAVLVLLEAAPRDVDVHAVGEAMAATQGVVEVHDLHVWTITSDFPALSAHVLVHQGDDCHAVRRTLEALLHDRFSIDHTTLQVEHRESDRLLTIAPTR